MLFLVISRVVSACVLVYFQLWFPVNGCGSFSWTVWKNSIWFSSGWKEERFTPVFTVTP